MAEFVPRTTAPSTSDRRYYADNPFYQSGYGMPNCTCYAYGRFWELLGSKPNLSLGDAEKWYGYNDGYTRGRTPKLGAIVVWGKGVVGDDSDGAGHVAVVEQVNADGSFRCSNSAWNSTNFYMKDIPASCALSGYTFLGFIYNPVNFDGEGFTVPTPVTGNRWLSKAEQENNATYIYWWFSQRGWSINAIAGMLGNMEVESKINPGIWEDLDTGDTSQGYGLVQWTPASKYLNWCSANGLEPSDMDSALLRIEWELANGEQYYSTTAYPLSFKEFKVSTKSPYYLGMAFATNYERPEEITSLRGENAEKWYQFLLTLPGLRPPKPIKKRTALPLWLMYIASRR